jgi:hypothetical protein
MTNTNTSWTEEQSDLLRKLHGEGLSFALIADEVGQTRNSCIGKARRMDLPMRVTVKSKNAEPRPKGQKRPYLRVVRANGNTTNLRLVETVETDLPTFQCEVVSLNKSLDELGHGDCRYIAGDPRNGAGIYCGHPVFNRSYCAAHFARCYVEPQKRWGAPSGIVQNRPSYPPKKRSVDSGDLLAADQVKADLPLASPETEAA